MEFGCEDPLTCLGVYSVGLEPGALQRDGLEPRSMDFGSEDSLTSLGVYCEGLMSEVNSVGIYNFYLWISILKIH